MAAIISRTPLNLISFHFCCRECNWTYDPPKVNCEKYAAWKKMGFPPHGKCCVRSQQSDGPLERHPQVWQSTREEQHKRVARQQKREHQRGTASVAP